MVLMNRSSSWLLYTFLTGILICLVGIVLNAFGKVPSQIVSIASGIGALAAFASAFLEILRKLGFTHHFQLTNFFPVLLWSLLTAGLLFCIIFAAPFLSSIVASFSISNYTGAQATGKGLPEKTAASAASMEWPCLCIVER